MIEYLIVLILLAFSALFSGLTLGLMGLNAPELKRKMSLGDKNAKKVYAVRKRGNLLLTTLLIGNVAINSALAIFLGSIASGIAAGIVATCLIVVFGEILPQAVFSRYALALGAKMAWLVKIFLLVFYPVSAPIAWLLNKTLGEELATVYSKKELIKIMDEHKAAKDSDVDAEEAQIIRGALTFSHKKVEDIMTPRTVMYTLPHDTVVDDEFIKTFHATGFSRAPIYKDNRDTIIGVLRINQLLEKKHFGKKIEDILSGVAHFTTEDDDLDNLFTSFIRSQRHLYIVKDEFGGVSGLVTLEDVLEEIIQEEIVDENDVHKDLRKFAAQKK